MKNLKSKVRINPLENLRRLMKQNNYGAYVTPTTDEHKVNLCLFRMNICLKVIKE